MKGYESKTIANQFISLAMDSGGLTHSKLQKLLYFSHAMSLATYGVPLVKDTFQAWPFGPVSVQLYLLLKERGKEKVKSLFEDVVEKLDDRTKDLIQIVYNRVGENEDWELSDFSHSDSPWKSVYVKGKSNPITNESIVNYYRTIKN